MDVAGAAPHRKDVKMDRFLKLTLTLPALAISLALSGCPLGPRVDVDKEVLRFDFDSATGEYEVVEELVVSNTGQDGLDFTISSDQPWATVSPASGTGLLADGTVTVTVTIDREFSNTKAATDFSTATLTITSNGGEAEVLATVAPDYFTEVFGVGDADIEGLAVTYTPNGGPSFFEATQSSITDFPTDPDAGRAFPLDFDAFGDPVKAGLFGDEKISYYGEEYDTLYISSQGWISFGKAGSDPTTVDDHFETPQISGLPVDATVAGSTVSYLQDDEKLVITYEDAVTKGAPGFPNDFQVELFYDGVVQLSFVNVDPAFSGVLGLSGGFGGGGSAPDDFVPSDFSGYNTGELKVVN